MIGISLITAMIQRMSSRENRLRRQDDPPLQKKGAQALRSNLFPASGDPVSQLSSHFKLAPTGGLWRSHTRPPMFEDIAEVIVTEKQIAERVAILGQEISELYRDAGELTIIAVVNGALIFTADLIRNISVPVRVDCMRVSSYREHHRPGREPEIIDMVRLDLRDRHVLVIDAILDTGHTAQKVIKEISKLKPRTLRFAVLLEKAGRREVPPKPNFVGFEIMDQIVIGYGLDFAERYRNLPFIGSLQPDLQNPPEWQ